MLIQRCFISLSRQPFGVVDLNEQISTIVDDGSTVHGFVRVDLQGVLGSLLLFYPLMCSMYYLVFHIFEGFYNFTILHSYAT